MNAFLRSTYSALFICALAAGCQSPVVVVDPAAPLTFTPTGPIVQDTTNVLERVRANADARIIMHLQDPATGQPLDFPTGSSFFERWGETPMQATGYPSGLIYAGMLSAADATGDRAFDDFDARRFQFFADNVPKFAHLLAKADKNPFRGWIAPRSLDNCGAMGAAFIKARQAGVGPDLKTFIDRFANFVSHKQYRLPDGTLARQRPFRSCLWLDDMYMSIPLLAQMGALTGEKSYYDDAARQVIQFSDRLFVPSTGLFTHACDMDAPEQQPTYYWGRANGWAIMAMCELLDVLPENHPQRAAILKLYRTHARALASRQSGQGLWHQMLDRPDSYLETSCSAMFTYAIAHGIDRGWLDGSIYGPVAITGWNAVKTRIDSRGNISGVCVGTSYAADYVYYYDRPSRDDQHGYGPVLMAGAEIIRLLKNPKYNFHFNESNPFMVVQKPLHPPAASAPTTQGDSTDYMPRPAADSAN
jgi:unsaturated rhamnogalacturonyl hydrolase